MFKKSWNQFTDNIVEFIKIYGIHMLITALFGLLFLVPVVNIFSSLLFLVYVAWFVIVNIRYSLKVCQTNEKVQVKDEIQESTSLIGRFLTYKLIQGVIIGIVLVITFVTILVISSASLGGKDDIVSILRSTFLFIMAMLISIQTVFTVVSIMFAFTEYTVVDSELDGLALTDRFKHGIKFTKEYKLKIFLFVIIQTALNMFGGALAGIGLILTAPLSIILMTNLYIDARDSYISKQVQYESNEQYGINSEHNLYKK